jgi:choline dehydrogenase-like flavoprotein
MTGHENASRTVQPPALGSGSPGHLSPGCLTPVSRGSVRLSGSGPGDKLMIDHHYLSDPGGHDGARLAEGVERVREIAGAPELRRLLGRETR